METVCEERKMSMKKSIGFTLIVLFILILCSCTVGNVIPEIPTAEPTTVLRDANGDVIPVYSDVDRSVLDPELFVKNETGRVFYDDDSISVYTGIDVSVFQGEIDWEKVKADGIDFVMLRAGYRGYGPTGKINEDAKFRQNFEGAYAAGLKIGVYFFSQAISVREAQEEADFVLDLIKDYDIAYPVAYDWEAIDYDTARTDGLDNDTITSCAAAFCEKIKNAGYESIIYFNRSLGYFSYDLSKVNDYHFWLAEYNDTPSFIYNYKLWQYSREGSVDGIEGSVDLNIAITDFSKTGSLG